MVRGITVTNEVHLHAATLGYTFLDDWSKEDQSSFLYGLGDRLNEMDEATGLAELFDFPEDLMLRTALAELGERLNRALRAPLESEGPVEQITRTQLDNFLLKIDRDLENLVKHFREGLVPDDPEGAQHRANSNRAFGADCAVDVFRAAVDELKRS